MIEGTSCLCATFADANNLVTGSTDFTVRIWRVARAGPGSSSSTVHLALSHMMRIHQGSVVAVAASRPWSIIVSGSEDGSAAVWDLNRGAYIRSLWHPPEGGKTHPVYLTAINESTVSGIYVPYLVMLIIGDRVTSRHAPRRNSSYTLLMDGLSRRWI